jgi:hypothetical protein
VSFIPFYRRNIWKFLWTFFFVKQHTMYQHACLICLDQWFPNVVTLWTPTLNKWSMQPPPIKNHTSSLLVGSLPF